VFVVVLSLALFPDVLPQQLLHILILGDGGIVTFRVAQQEIIEPLPITGQVVEVI